MAILGRLLDAAHIVDNLARGSAVRVGGGIVEVEVDGASVTCGRAVPCGSWEEVLGA